MSYMKFCQAVGSLSKGVFELHTSTGSTAFSHFDMPCPTMQNVHFRLASVAQKRLSLSSLVSKT